MYLKIGGKETIFFYFCLLPLRFNRFKIVIWQSQFCPKCEWPVSLSKRRTMDVKIQIRLGERIVE